MSVTSAHNLNEVQKTYDKPKTKHISPSHRHAAPSAPWPWIDVDDKVDSAELNKDTSEPETCDHSPCKFGAQHSDSAYRCWVRYPQSLYPNWTQGQIKKSKIGDAIQIERSCNVYQIDVNTRGIFKLPDPDVISSSIGDKETTWKAIIQPNIPTDNRVRALFIQDLSGPVLQMLGTMYNIEPFFFSSSLNWIPSRYQENPVHGEGDHITICLVFLRSVKQGTTVLSSDNSPSVLGQSATLNSSMTINRVGTPTKMRPSSAISVGTKITEVINTQEPLRLMFGQKDSDRWLIRDLLSVHLIRKKRDSTIISYHADSDKATTARYLHERIRFAGKSVYWQNIFRTQEDPTFVLLLFVWHTLYAWDEALEDLYSYISSIEAMTISTKDLLRTQELHSIRAHLYYYFSLLDDSRKTVEFIRTTKNPALDDTNSKSDKIMARECANLLAEINRLEEGRKLQDSRLKNVMNLVFSSVNIEDSKSMQEMTRMTARDSAAMKQIAYLTMFFLPASFVAAIFGMNVEEISPGTKGTLSHYVETAFPFTLMTVWIIIAFQSKYFFPENMSLWKRLGWPLFLLLRLCGKDLYPVDAKKRNDDPIV